MPELIWVFARVHRSYCRFCLAMTQIKVIVHARTKTKMFGLSNSNIRFIRDNLWRWKCSFWLNATFQENKDRAMQTYLRTFFSLDRAHIMPATVLDYVVLLTHQCRMDFYHITKTCLYNVDPLKPHFYIVKLGFTGVYIILLISAQKHRLWVLVRTASPRRF